LGTVSHELRTPLTSIIGYSEMLAEGITGELNPEQKEFVTTIHEKGEQLLQLITSLLDLSKLESGTMAMRRKLSEIHPVLADVQSTCLPNALKKGVKLVLDLDAQGCELSADPERLRQVFINLVDNAIKFTPKDGTVTIESRVVDDVDEADASEGFSLLSPMEKSVRVRVRDTGIGIPAHERPKVFDPFYQVDSSSTREYGGTGLGLSIVKRLVEGHGGTVSIEANEPTGAVFVVVLPSAATSRSQKSSLPPPLFR
jgi:signal transduction histidine kinase